MSGPAGGPPRFPPPADFPIALDEGTSLWSGGRVATGGAPWKVVRLADAARPRIAALRRAGGRGLADPSPVGRAVARPLLDHWLAPPVPAPRPGPHEVTVVIPAYGRADELERCLAAVEGLPVIVVDDASPDPRPLRRAAGAAGARLVRHAVNRGPAAARNTGLRLVETPLAALVDSDCRPEAGWLDVLVPHFDDPRVAAVAPRVRPDPGDRRLLARYETARSALDMGVRPALVRPGGRLGFVPTATLLVRVAAVRDLGSGGAFDEGLRLGEDVDFVWRLGDLGWNVRYEPDARVAHTARLRPVDWARRRHEYGTSAADLARRHPGRLAPARPSMWNLAVLGLLARGRPGLAAACSAVAAARRAPRLA
ncbi:mycofactocin biosynthesis glycosyltransferase MftF, partial [Actinomadura sediminis]